MKRLLALLALLFLGPAALAATGLKPGAFSEFNVELPQPLRMAAGKGQLSPVAHALVTISAPPNLDREHLWPVMVVSATSDPQFNSSRGLLAAYAETARKSGWILVAVDPVESVPVEKDDVALRIALTTVALAALDLQMPTQSRAPLAFGGFSGGAKYSGWLAAAFANRGRNIAGIYLAGINAETAISAAEYFKVLNSAFRRVPVFLLYGENDTVATPAEHRNIYDELLRNGFRNVRIESFPGAHEVDPAPMGKALDWFRELAPQPAGTAK